MKTGRKCLIFLMLILLVLPLAVSANSAEPPGIIVIASDLPADAQVTLVWPEGTQEVRVHRSTKLWETYFRLYYSHEKDVSQAVLQVTVGEESVSFALPTGEYTRYNTLLTLDYVNRKLTLGQNPWRQPLLTALRVVLTLLAEGAVFWAFGFRKKASWIAFLVINLVTQGGLNLMLNGYAFSGGYWIFAFIGAELLIFLGEAVALPLTVREHSAGRKIVCALVANGVSLAAGLLLIGQLPI